MKKRAVIVDLDGTLCDLRHRLRFMEHRPKLRDEFHAAASFDLPYMDVKRFIEAMNDHVYIILLTCRPEKYRQPTIDWLERFDIPFDDLIMRQDGDTRPDADVKSLIYHYEIEPHYNVEMVLEDKTSVCNMWRARGLNCWQVRVYDA